MSDGVCPAEAAGAADGAGPVGALPTFALGAEAADEIPVTGLCVLAVAELGIVVVAVGVLAALGVFVDVDVGLAVTAAATVAFVVGVVADVAGDAGLLAVGAAWARAV